MTAHGRAVPLDLGHHFFEPGDRVTDAYFVEQGVISIVTMLKDGAGVESATVGPEGALGLSYCLTGARAYNRAVVQAPGSALMVSCDNINAAVAGHPGLVRLFGRYTEQILAESQQSAACNALHTLERRMSKWLLRCHDRIESDTLPLTQEFLSHMLGAQRTTVTTVLRNLSKAGALRTMRGRILIVDRALLERTSCECYGALRAHAEDLGFDLARH